MKVFYQATAVVAVLLLGCGALPVNAAGLTPHMMMITAASSAAVVGW